MRAHGWSEVSIDMCDAVVDGKCDIACRNETPPAANSVRRGLVRDRTRRCSGDRRAGCRRDKHVRTLVGRLRAPPGAAGPTGNRRPATRRRRRGERQRRAGEAGEIAPPATALGNPRVGSIRRLRSTWGGDRWVPDDTERHRGAAGSPARLLDAERERQPRGRGVTGSSPRASSDARGGHAHTSYTALRPTSPGATRA